LSAPEKTACALRSAWTAGSSHSKKATPVWGTPSPARLRATTFPLARTGVECGSQLCCSHTLHLIGCSTRPHARKSSPSTLDLDLGSTYAQLKFPTEALPSVPTHAHAHALAPRFRVVCVLPHLTHALGLLPRPLFCCCTHRPSPHHDCQHAHCPQPPFGINQSPL